MVFDGPEPLKSIEKQTLLLILGHSKKQWKNDANRDLKSHVFRTKMVTWAFQFRLIIWFLKFWCDARKSSFLDAFPMDQEIEKSRALWRQGPQKSARAGSGASRAVLLNNKTIKQQAVGALSATPRPMARRIICISYIDIYVFYMILYIILYHTILSYDTILFYIIYICISIFSFV